MTHKKQLGDNIYILLSSPLPSPLNQTISNISDSLFFQAESSLAVTWTKPLTPRIKSKAV